MLLTAAASSRDVTTSASLDILFFGRVSSPFDVNFAALCERADRKRLLRTGNTAIRVFAGRNIIYKVALSACTEMTDKPLEFSSVFFLLRLRCSPFIFFFICVVFKFAFKKKKTEFD